MNRLELQKQIISAGKKKGIIITECRIYDRGKELDFYPEIQNNYSDTWIYKHQVEEIIHNLAPLERPHRIDKIALDESRYDLFKQGDKIEVENIWIRLDAGEKEPKKLINVSAGCGQWRQGWVKGTVFETDRFLGIKFDRDVYFEQDEVGWIGSVDNLEKLVREGKIVKLEAGQPTYSGTHLWSIRKPRENNGTSNNP